MRGLISISYEQNRPHRMAVHKNENLKYRIFSFSFLERMAKQVSVTREELRELRAALHSAKAGSDAEVAGDQAVDDRAARACDFLATFAEEQGERGAI